MEAHSASSSILEGAVNPYKTFMFVKLNPNKIL